METLNLIADILRLAVFALLIPVLALVSWAAVKHIRTPGQPLLDVGYICEATETLTRTASDLLSAAGEPITRESLLDILLTLPLSREDKGWHDGRAARCLGAMWRNPSWPYPDKERIATYFIEHIPSLPSAHWLVHAAIGVLLAMPDGQRASNLNGVVPEPASAPSQS